MKRFPSPFSWFAILAALVWILPLAEAALGAAPHRFIIQGNSRLAILDRAGQVEWEMPWGPIHDVHVLENGNIMVQKGSASVAEIDVHTKNVVWSYDSAKQGGNEGKPVEVHAFQPLPSGNVMIAESGPSRIIEVDRHGKIVKEFALMLDHPHPHTDTRLARKLENGHYLVCHEADGVIREYDESGKVIWDFEVPLFGKEKKDGHGPEAFGNKAFSAIRLPSGNTLIGGGNGHCVLEVTPAKEIVWKLEQNDLPGIILAWVTTVEVTSEGTYVIGNCHAGPENPQLIEIDPASKQVRWTFQDFKGFGNDVSNTKILD